MPTRSDRCLIWLVTLFALLAVMAGCAASGAAEEYVYVDGTRGCREAEHDITLWDHAGAVPAGAQAVGSVPHGVRLAVQGKELAFGVMYYLVEYGNAQGWLPENYTETIPPVCE